MLSGLRWNPIQELHVSLRPFIISFNCERQRYSNQIYNVLYGHTRAYLKVLAFIFVNKTSLMQFFTYLLYPSQLYMFRMLRPSILRSTVMYRREGTVYVRCNIIYQVSKIS